MLQFQNIQVVHSTIQNADNKYLVKFNSIKDNTIRHR